MSPFFFPSVSPYRTALAVLTLCSFVLAVALVTTLLVVCLFKHTPLALVTPEVIIILLLLILTSSSSSCGVRARACVHWLGSVLCVALCLRRLERSSLGVHHQHTFTHHNIGISTLKRNTSLRDKTKSGSQTGDLPRNIIIGRQSIDVGRKGEISTMPHAGGNGPKKMTLPSRAGIALVFIIIIIIIITIH